eukprot:gene23711-9898_t
MPSDNASFAAAPVLVLAVLSLLGIGFSSSPGGVLFDAALLSAVFMVVGLLLSPIEGWFVGHHYAANQDVYRPYNGFAPRYMLLHPLLLGSLCATVWGVFAPSLGSSEVGFPAFKLHTAIAIAGALPVYTLGFASHRTPAAVVVAWQAHTAAQLLIGGFILDCWYT